MAAFSSASLLSISPPFQFWQRLPWQNHLLSFFFSLLLPISSAPPPFPSFLFLPFPSSLFPPPLAHLSFFLKLSSQTSLTCILPSLLASLCRLLFWPVTLSQTQLAWPTCSQAPPPPLFLYLLFLTTLVQGFVKACPLVKGLPFWQGFCPLVKGLPFCQGLRVPFSRVVFQPKLEQKNTGTQTLFQAAQQAPRWLC